MNALNCDGIRQTMLSGATLLDVRTANEFNGSALPGAKNIPLALLPLLANERLDKDETVLIYCREGGRALMAEKILQALGFTDVTNIGSIQQYQHCH